MRKLGSGVVEASALNIFRSPQAVNQALQRMAPSFVAEDGLEDEDIVLLSRRGRRYNPCIS